MKKLILLLLFIPLVFSCETDNDDVEMNLLELLKGKVYQKDIPNGKRYVHFDLTYLGEDPILGENYEGWTFYEKLNLDSDELGCFLTYSISSSDFGLYLQWYTDTIINNPQQFKLDGIYNQTWIVTKNNNDMISIEYGGDPDIDDDYTEMSLEEFIELDCM